MDNAGSLQEWDGLRKLSGQVSGGVLKFSWIRFRVEKNWVGLLSFDPGPLLSKLWPNPFRLSDHPSAAASLLLLFAAAAHLHFSFLSLTR